jgi:hypothetical protein
MNREQHARARAVIESAVFLCEGILAADTPRPAPGLVIPERGFVCCAMGELLVAAGYGFDDLRDDPDNWTTEYPRVLDVYGLNNAGCLRIVGANECPLDTLGHEASAEFMTDFDEYDLPRARKAAVLLILDRLVAA